ncbi:MAG: HD domain-containing protein [Vicinamibacterales bacterium]
MAVLTALTGSFTVQIPGMVARLSVSEPFVFASALLFGPAAGTVTVAIDAVVMSTRLLPGVRTLHRVLFNVGALAISVALSSTLFFRLSGTDPHRSEYPSIEGFVWPLYAFAATCFLTNSGIVALALAVERGQSPFAIWRRQFMWLSLNYLAGASVAALIVVYARTVAPAILAIVLPLIAILYLTFRTTLGRLDDANRHLSEVNSLYLSTIETLAMAIDAKDQVTHGHIRRVQRFAVGLAKALGVTDERHLRAIEAAALLHDMGKLAIPEFILNKPGKLSQKEFAVMKTHAAIGADLLSSIKFPYPVVPIVRHHHENWDGSGYPDGLRGAEIPIGARILSVVDCYDALTSDRPYRPALTSAAALEILSQRRGRMYDPLVVDTFIREHHLLQLNVAIDSPASPMLAKQVDGASADDGSAPHMPSSPIEALRLLAGLVPFEGQPSLDSVARQLFESLRTIAPFDTAALFVPDMEVGDLKAVAAFGAGGQSLLGLRVDIAERLTGWVAANRTAIWNSSASLDLAGIGDLAAALTTASALPLVQNEQLVGVITLYGTQEQDISIPQRLGLESLTLTISTAVADATARPRYSIDAREHAARQATLDALETLLSHALSPAAPGSSFDLGALVLDVSVGRSGVAIRPHGTH